ncbi:MAG: GNAT family N-acetyltransferase, partial [Burkholderiales bacterium]
RACCDPDNQRAEFAIQITTDWQQRGLGHAMLTRLLEHLHRRGVRQVWGECLTENVGMVALARELGFAVSPGLAPGLYALQRSLG